MKRYSWLLIMLLPALVFAAPGDKITVGGMSLPLSADSVTDGTTNKAFTAAEKAKLSTLDATQLRDRSTHTGTQPATTIATDDSHQFATTAEKSAWNAKQDALGFIPMSPSNNLSDLASPATARAALGLDKVSNTADSDKPISSAMQAALNARAPLAAPTFTDSVTAPTFNSSAADGYHYILPYNSTTFAGTPLAGMIQTTPTGPQWYTGSAWEAIGSGGGGTWGSITGTLSAQTDLQAALDAITAGGITINTGIPSTPGAAYLNDTTHILTVASSTGYTQFTGSFTAWDTTHEAFSFTDLTDVALSTEQTATPVQISGINYPAAVTATGGTAAICTGATVDTCGTFSASPGNIANNQYVSAKHTSSASNSTAVDTTVSIGGVSDVFNSTTEAGGASCSLISSMVSGTLVNVPIGNDTGHAFAGGVIQGGQSAINVCQIDVYVRSVVGDVSNKSYEARVYGVNGSYSLTTLKGSSSTVSGASLATGSWVTFSFPTSISMVDGDAWVITATTAADSSNYVNFGQQTSTVGTYTDYRRWSSGYVIQSTNTTPLYYRIYGQ